MEKQLRKDWAHIEIGTDTIKAYVSGIVILDGIPRTLKGVSEAIHAVHSRIAEKFPEAFSMEDCITSVSADDNEIRIMFHRYRTEEELKDAEELKKLLKQERIEMLKRSIIKNYDDISEWLQQLDTDVINKEKSTTNERD